MYTLAINGTDCYSHALLWKLEIKGKWTLSLSLYFFSKMTCSYSVVAKFFLERMRANMWNEYERKTPFWSPSEPIVSESHGRWNHGPHYSQGAKCLPGDLLIAESKTDLSKICQPSFHKVVRLRITNIDTTWQYVPPDMIQNKTHSIAF